MIKNYIYTAVFLFSVLLTACGGNKNAVSDQSNLDCSDQDEAIELLLALPEIKELSSYLEQTTDEKKGVSTLAGNDSDDATRYEIQIGYNGEDRFETYFFFQVSKKTCEITVMDPTSGTTISLEEWQKQQKEL